MTALRIQISGLVQGVGFRPYVWRLANDLGLSGWVRNDAGGVCIAVTGEDAALRAFVDRLPREAPPLARIDAMNQEASPPEDAPRAGFVIADSAGGRVATAIGPDTTVCGDCRDDLFNAAERRYRYAFTTCTHCGPRYTVSRGLPYDRARTSLAPFPLCPACAAEYSNPANRRFHAETTCCPACGPALSLLDANGLAMAGDAIAETLRLLQTGHIVALKGLGGFHLACDARNPQAVAALRQRKQRDAKPFAVMAANTQSLATIALLGEGETRLLQSREAPIVLCPKGEEELAGIAPGLALIGVMLPATPLHLLLWHEAAGRPAGQGWLTKAQPLLLVMTSANPHGEPLVIGNVEAALRLSGIADAILLHNRDIVVRCDDSVVRPTAPGQPAFLRRARGYTPLPIRLAETGASVIALGAHLKNTLCITRGQEAFLSQHIGGLDNATAILFAEEIRAHLLNVLEVTPQAVAHDLHPDYASSRLAAELAAALDIPAIAVGHHHAHLAALCAEAGIDPPLLGLALDGVGLGADGGLWGGELLRLEGAGCTRLGHLSPLPLPGGDRAARSPWRMAAAALDAAGLSAETSALLARRFGSLDASPALRQLERRINCPLTTSLGRWFDAAAGLLGVCAESRYEGEAAMRLEGLAARHGPAAPLPLTGLSDNPCSGLDLTPLVRWLARCDDPALGAATFHNSLIDGLADWLCHALLQEQNGAEVRFLGQPTVAIAGGCAMNRVLVDGLENTLAERGIRLLTARRAPPNDGGIALGQAWVARRVLAL